MPVINVEICIIIRSMLRDKLCVLLFGQRAEMSIIVWSAEGERCQFWSVKCDFDSLITLGLVMRFSANQLVCCSLQRMILSLNYKEAVFRCGTSPASYQEWF